MDDFIEFLVMGIIVPLMLAAVMITIICLGLYGIYKYPANDLVCTSSHEYDREEPVIVGKLIHTKIVHHSDCTQWSVK